MAVGDVFSQTLVEKKKFKEMDPVRIARFGAMGVVFMVKMCLKYIFVTFLEIKIQS